MFQLNVDEEEEAKEMQRSKNFLFGLPILGVCIVGRGNKKLCGENVGRIDRNKGKKEKSCGLMIQYVELISGCQFAFHSVVFKLIPTAAWITPFLPHANTFHSSRKQKLWRMVVNRRLQDPTVENFIDPSPQ